LRYSGKSAAFLRGFRALYLGFFFNVTIMVALFLDSRDKVDALHKKALELGGTNEGNPGFRPAENDKGFYAGYFRDLDGNKLNAFCMVE